MMIKQFNMKTMTFSDPKIIIHDDDTVNYMTTGDGWYPIYSHEDVNAISASITGGGAVWVDDDKLKWSGKAPSQYHQWQNGSWVLDFEKQAELKTQQQEQMRQAINALRDKKINGGVYVPAIDKWIDTDATAERNILSVKATFDLFGDQEIPWTFADNSVAMINKEKLLVIWQVLMEAKTGNHANALKHKAMMEQVENPLDYDYSQGWSKTYADHLAEVGNE